MTTRYASADQFRAETNVQSGEYSDSDLEQFLDAATVLIDNRTGRTWQGIQTVTDEYYDGNGETFLFLDNVDLTSLDALSINEDFDGTYTSVTLDYTRYYSATGRIELDVENSDSKIEVDAFIKGPKTVKVSYKYGHAAPTEEITELCILIVEYRLNPTAALRSDIDRRIRELKADGVEEI